MTRPLAVFDIDGTLLQTVAADDPLWALAAAEALGIHDVDTDWSAYNESTDLGILVELIERHQDTPHNPLQLQAWTQRYCELLREAVVDHPAGFGRTPGVPEVFEALTARGWGVALATGTVRGAAEIKLAAANIPHATLPKATADDARAREDIIRTAVGRATGDDEPFDRVIYVGDGVWDVVAARAAGIGFVGIGTEEAADRLRAEGAGIVLPDFSDLDAVFQAFETAPVPA